jgi:hypothetical protein
MVRESPTQLITRPSSSADFASLNLNEDHRYAEPATTRDSNIMGIVPMRKKRKSKNTYNKKTKRIKEQVEE